MRTLCHYGDWILYSSVYFLLVSVLRILDLSTETQFRYIVQGHTFLPEGSLNVVGYRGIADSIKYISGADGGHEQFGVYHGFG